MVPSHRRLDGERIVRPERFIRPEVSGLAVPSMVAIGDRPVGRWLVYLRWQDGRRERRAMSATVKVSEDQQLWVYPMPSEPTPNMKAGWERVGRKRWLEGEVASNPATLFENLCDRIAWFIDLPRDQAFGVIGTLAIWTLLTYVYPAWDAVPYLYVGGPLGSGKSRVFEILARMVFRPLSSSNMTGAALFRSLHANGGVLLLDEAERLKNKQDPGTGDVVSMLLAGYSRGGAATRLELIGCGEFKTVSFDVFGPKALACISGLPPALASRAIPVMMFRSSPTSEKPRRRIDEAPDEWQRFRDDLHAVALEHGGTWLELAHQNTVCPNMSGRDYELWQPILAIASWIEEHGAKGLLRLMQAHALASIEASAEEGVRTLTKCCYRFLRVRFGEGAPTAAEVLDGASKIDLAVFKNWTARGVSEHLKRYGVVTKKSHGRKLYSGVTSEQLQDIQVSYGIDLTLGEDEWLA